MDEQVIDARRLARLVGDHDRDLVVVVLVDGIDLLDRRPLGAARRNRGPAKQQRRRESAADRPMTLHLNLLGLAGERHDAELTRRQEDAIDAPRAAFFSAALAARSSAKF